eukprot:TRINITY_DN3758_c0_g2_i1.p1 TRINITY_DN3758_c0_g2~~TRINITY_DN3758_c0_g2_i1.p1  ORF type:complete len:250 (-),score=70.51 TRINITY_DN3758_c0_g2_i1:34-729(-)
MGAHCCCCCAARDGMDGEPLKTPLRPTTPDKAEPLAAVQSLEANGAAQEALQALEENTAAVEAPEAVEMVALEANGVEEEAQNVAEMQWLEASDEKEAFGASSTAYSSSPDESFEVDEGEASWTFNGRGSNSATGYEIELLTELMNKLVALPRFWEALEKDMVRKLFNQLVHPWAEDEKQLYFHYGRVAGTGHQKTVEIQVVSWETVYDFTITWSWDCILDDDDFKFRSSA